MIRPTRKRVGAASAATLALAGLACLGLTATAAFAAPPADNSANTATPIKHVVVIFPENESFDHYFGTYPVAQNTDGVPFTAAADTPTPNNYEANPDLLTNNPNVYQPVRLTHEQAWTCSQNHNYAPEQQAENNGAMDQFYQNTESHSCVTNPTPATQAEFPGMVMGYYDGNTVTAMWNYAQHYALSDNSWDAGFGPSTPGALNLISGNTHGGVGVNSITGAVDPASTVLSAPDPTTHVGTVTGDPDPFYDDCADTNHTATTDLVQMQGKNIGDLLNAQGVTWGWFQGGFAPTTAAADSPTGYAVCGQTMTNIGGQSVTSYSAHHSPFEYYASTSNPHHLPPTSVAAIGHTDQANHNYDTTDFDAALAAGNLPAVSFLKPPAAQDAHPSNSDPIDEQAFLVKEINALEKSPEWSSTAVVISYDDSDGWYDHVAPTILNGSADPVTDTTMCSSAATVAGGYQDRCGPSQRLPMLVISPYARSNHIDHAQTSQPSIIHFIEDNWRTDQATPGGIGDGSLDRSAIAGPIDGMFDFANPSMQNIQLADDGTVASISAITAPAAAPEPGPALAATGVNGTGILFGSIGGVLLLGAGVVLILTRRPRRKQAR